MQRVSVIVLLVLLVLGWSTPTVGEGDVSKPPKGMNIKFENVDITKALETISKATGMKVAVEMGLKLEGQVDLTLNTADWRKGLTVALSQIGLAWDETPTHIIVME